MLRAGFPPAGDYRQEIYADPLSGPENLTAWEVAWDDTCDQLAQTGVRIIPQSMDDTDFDYFHVSAVITEAVREILAASKITFEVPAIRAAKIQQRNDAAKKALFANQKAAS